MIQYLLRIFIRQKLLLGVLWLMLRGSNADGQELTLSKHITCYKTRLLTPTQKLYKSIVEKNDFSVDFQTNYKSPLFTSLAFQLGHNFGKKTIGLDITLNQSESLFYAGPYLRLFPYDKPEQPFTFMVEFKYISSTNKEIMRDGLSISTGLIIRNPYAISSGFGIEVFECLTTDVTVSSGFVFYSGLRIHYYIYGR